MKRFRVLSIAVGLILVGLVTVVAYLSVGGLRVRRPASKLDERFNAPETVEQTKAFLDKVKSQINALPPGDSQSNEVEMIKLSAAVYGRAIEHPELPEVWITAAMVISRRLRHDAKTVAPTCAEDLRTPPRIGSPDKSERVTFTTYGDCAISLDGDGGVMKRNRLSTVKNPRINVLELRHVHVTYRGGSFPSIATLTCIQCTFDLQLRGIPPLRGKSFIRGLLVTYSEDFAIEISNDSQDRSPAY